MAYGYYNYNTADVVMRQSFAAYVEKFKSTKPINSTKSKYAVPLGNRKHWRMASISMPDDATVNLNYYGSPLVVWKSDDSFEVFPPKYYASYSIDNIQQFVPNNIGFMWDKGRVMVTVGEKAIYWLREDGSLKFRKSGDSFELIDVPTEYAVRKIRGSDKKFLEVCEPFLEWMELVQSIDNKPVLDINEELNDSRDSLFKEMGLMTADEFDKFSSSKEGNTILVNRWDIVHTRQHYPHGGDGTWRGSRHNGFDKDGCVKLMEWVTSPLSDNWVHALNVIRYNQGIRKHDRDDNNAYRIKIILDRKGATKYLSEIIMFLHFDKCFRKVPLGAGEVPTKQNLEFTQELGPVL